MRDQMNGAAHKANAHQSKIYSEFSHLYDKIFERVFFPRIEQVVTSLRIPPGARVLEIGVGTGLSLSAYPPHCEVIGVDLAQDMLDQAQDKIRRNNWSHISLQQMDALDLRFASNSFDYVTAFHVISVVPDAHRMMNEAMRVCRPGGTLVLINHFRSANPVFGTLVEMLDPVTRKLGWRTTLRLTDVVNGAPLEVAQCFKTSPRSLFTVLVARNRKELAAVG